ncbi:MAG: CBS domain-containing protein [Thermoplasmata archaeon]|nr:CBS domain-containing protein [Thermoplasmata archaeon]
MVPLKEIKAKDIAEKPAEVISPEETISEAVGKLLKTEERVLPVVEKKSFLGMISLKSLLKRRKIPLNARVRHFTFMPPRIDPDTSLFDIADIMIYQNLRALPVVKGERLKGVVSIRSVLKAAAQDPLVGGARVGEIMNPSPASLSEEENSTHAVRFMVMEDYRALPVVDSGGKVTGVVGLKDLMRVLEKPQSKSSKGEVRGEKEPTEVLVKSISTPPVTVSVKATIREAVERMLSNSTNILVIVDEEGRLAGIVTERDVLEKIIRLKKETRPFIQIAGVDDVHADELPAFQEIIEKNLKKVERFVEPVAITVRIKHHHHTEDKTKYTVSLKLSTPYDIYVVEEWDWGMSTALNKCFRKLQKILKKEKERRTSR